MKDKKDIITGHIDTVELDAVHIYPDHQHRYESPEFRHVKEQFEHEHTKCFIDNGRCEGNIEIHHNIIEWAMNNGVDWEKVKHDFPNVDNVDDADQMMVLCAKHHRHKYFGIHMVDYPTWIAQKYMTDDMLDKFEAEVETLRGK